MSKKDDEDVEETDDTDRSDDSDRRGIADAVREGVAEALDKLGIGRHDDSADDHTDHETDDDVIDETQQTRTRRTHRDIEDDTESQVRAVLGKVRKEEETDARLKAVEERTAEKPPAKERRITRALWGSAAK